MTSLTPCPCAFVVTKHSWKGKYRRVLSLTPEGVSTHNPASMEATNTWKWMDVVGVQPLSSPSGSGTSGCGQEFQLIYRKANNKNKTDQMRFSSEWRSQILTDIRSFIQFYSQESPDIISATKVSLIQKANSPLYNKK